MSNPGTSMLVLGFVAIVAAVAMWYALAPFNPSLSISTDPNGRSNGTRSIIDPTDDARSLDRSVFDVVLWHEPPAPPPSEAQPKIAVVREMPPPTLDLLAISRTSVGYEAVFYDKQADRLLVVCESDELGPYRVAGIGLTWAKLNLNGREMIIRVDQPRIAVRENAGKAASMRQAEDD